MNPAWPQEEEGHTNKLPITLLKIFSSADKAISTANKEDFGYYTSQSNFCKVMVADPIPKETSTWFTINSYWRKFFGCCPCQLVLIWFYPTEENWEEEKEEGKNTLIWRNWRQASATQLWLTEKYLRSAVHKIQSLLLAIENVPASGWTQQSERQRNNMK